MKYYRDLKSGTVYPRYAIEIQCFNTTKNHAPWIVDDYIKKHSFDDVTELYEWLAEKFIWSDEEEQKPISISTAMEWLEYWKEDYEEFCVSFNPYNFTVQEIVDVWNYIVEWNAE